QEEPLHAHALLLVHSPQRGVAPLRGPLLRRLLRGRRSLPGLVRERALLAVEVGGRRCRSLDGGGGCEPPGGGGAGGGGGGGGRELAVSGLRLRPRRLLPEHVGHSHHSGRLVDSAAGPNLVPRGAPPCPRTATSSSAFWPCKTTSSAGTASSRP